MKRQNEEEMTVMNNLKNLTDYLYNNFMILLHEHPEALNAIEIRSEKTYLTRRITIELHCCMFEIIPCELVHLMLRWLDVFAKNLTSDFEKKTNNDKKMSFIPRKIHAFPPFADYDMFTLMNYGTKLISENIVSYFEKVKNNDDTEEKNLIIKLIQEHPLVVVLGGLVSLGAVRIIEKYPAVCECLLIIQLLKNKLSKRELFQYVLELKKIKLFFQRQHKTSLEEQFNILNCFFIFTNLSPIPIYSKDYPREFYHVSGSGMFWFDKKFLMDVLYEALVYNFYPTFRNTVHFPNWGAFPEKLLMTCKQFIKENRRKKIEENLIDDFPHVVLVPSVVFM